jgi:signal transduction histidine kinase
MASATSSPAGEPRRRGLRLRLRSVVLLVNAIVFVLPIAGFVLLRVYDNQLIRQTESELIAQGAFISEAYKSALLASGQAIGGRPIAPQWQSLHNREDGLRPIQPTLDALWENILPPAEGPLPTSAPASAPPSQALSDIMRGARATTLAGIRVVDAAGIVVASTRSEVGLSLAHREEVRRALEGENVSVLRRRTSDEPAPPLSSLSRSSGVRVFVTLPIVLRNQVIGAVLLARTPMTLGKAFYQDRYALALTGALMILVVTLISFLTSLTIVRPMKALVAQSRRVAAGSDTSLEPISNPVTEEVGELSLSFSEVARSLKERADYIRSFASHVSHEFKTPLAAIHGAVEILEEHWQTMADVDRARFLRNIREDNERLERLVRKLLELARADAYRPGDEAVDLRAVIDQVVARHTAAGLKVTASVPDGEVWAAISSETLESILSSLLDNARAHGGADVSLVVERREQQVQVLLSDTGPGISPANAERIFDAFFTTARAKGSTGLGLSIARSLLTAHGGSISLVPSAQGACFRITLPQGTPSAPARR